MCGRTLTNYRARLSTLCLQHFDMAVAQHQQLALYNDLTPYQSVAVSVPAFPAAFVPPPCFLHWLSKTHRFPW